MDHFFIGPVVDAEKGFPHWDLIFRCEQFKGHTILVLRGWEEESRGILLVSATRQQNIRGTVLCHGQQMRGFFPRRPILDTSFFYLFFKLNSTICVIP